MTTKEQERKAIEQIKKIVEGLGTESYVGFAMKGVLEVAEENIREDAAYSLQDRFESAYDEKVELQGKVEEMENYIKQTELELQRERTECGQFAKLAEQRKMPVWCRQELEKMANNQLEGTKDYIEQLADRLADSVDGGNVANDIEETAKKYKEEKCHLEQLKKIPQVLNRYKDGEANE